MTEAATIDAPTFPPVTIRTWHDRYPRNTDEQFDENGNEYWFVECRNADDERVFDATGFMKRDVANEIARRWNSHDALLAALEAVVAHLGAAKMQRAPADDKIIADHIDAALEIAKKARAAKSTTS